ncbi:MAG: hypothetical protein V4717_14580 [Bacteroidota bacterium]
MINIELHSLKQRDLPAWDSPDLETFVLQWLWKIGFPLDGLHDPRYNYAIQDLVTTHWIGEKTNDPESVREYNEFRFSVVIVLSSFIPGSKYYKERKKDYFKEPIRTTKKKVPDPLSFGVYIREFLGI